MKYKKLSHAEITENRSTLETIDKIKKLPVHIILENIRSSYNVGSIFRSSDGAMIEHLYLSGYTPSPQNKDVLKTSLGAQDSVNWSKIDNSLELIQNLKKQGIKIAALELTEKSIPHYNFDKNDFPVALVVGNEISGVSQEILNECDITLEIPQYGIKQSLNVAVAYGIAVFELRKIFDT